MKSTTSHLSLAIAAGGFLAFVVLASGVWLPRFPAGGLTQVGRTESVTFEDGSVLNLTESDYVQDTLKKRRMRGWNGHEFQQTFVMADGEEIELTSNRPQPATNDNELNTGNYLMVAATTVNSNEHPILDGKNKQAVMANLQIDGKDKVITNDVDSKDRVYTDVIDGKDRVYTDGKDAVQQPVFALTADQSFLGNEGLDTFLLGDSGGGGFDLGNLRSPTGDPVGTGGNITAPPIGGAVPEPSALALVGVAGALGLVFKARRR